MYRQDIHFPAKDVQLREDVHALGVLVGEILREQSGEALFREVEADRVLAIRRREGDPAATAELRRHTAGRAPAEARDLVRAFSTWFQVVNVAEKVHRIRRRRQYLSDSGRPQPGGLEEAVLRLRQEGLDVQSVERLFERIGVFPVFTSHPTESTRRTLLRMQQRLATLLIAHGDPQAGPSERRASWEQLRTELTCAWQTEEHPRERLTVADEREHVLFYLVEILYRILPRFYEELAGVLQKILGAPADMALPSGLLRFGSWVGADMDGNPDVHAKTIRETLQRQHQVLVNAYFGEVQRLGARLSQSASRVGISRALDDRSREYLSLVPTAQGAQARHDRMPYRTFCSQIAERLRMTYESASGQYENLAQFHGDVELIAASLKANRGEQAGLFYVERLLRRIRTFGFHLATLDVRQHAEIHERVIAQGFADDDWSQRPAEERIERLTRALDRETGPTGAFDAIGRRTLAVFEALVHCRHRYGKAAIGDYVVSGASSADHVLSVLVLARWAEMVDKKTGQVPLDVAPLVESVAALEQAPAMLRVLIAAPCYRRHLAGRGDRQTIMLGYSDSNKDAGFAAARWALHHAQDVLASELRASGIALTVFHGRGGATSRGGGRLATLVRSAPPGAFDGVLRVTEQGEAIDLGYGLRPIALRTLEQAFAAVSVASGVQPRYVVEDRALQAVMETVASASREPYAELVHGDRGFYAYFRAATPIDVIERIQIGARPAMREGKSGLEALRAVPWGFAWSQCRQFFPGWYGMGAGLAAAERRHGEEALSTLLVRWPYFASLMEDLELTMAKVDMEIAGLYAELAGPELAHYFTRLKDEFVLTRDFVLKLRGEQRLLDGEPTMQRSVKLRNPYLDPMHMMQIDLLRRWREGGSRSRDLFDALVASIGGIAQGLQGTG